MATLAMLFGIPALSLATAGPAAADATHQVAVEMPFTGKWAYNADRYAPYSDTTSSHPSVHHTPGGGNWATDLYASEGTAVKLKVGASTGNVTFSWGTSSTSCGQSTRINVFVDGTNVGWLYFAHINNAVTSGAITNGMTIGTMHDWGGCNPGLHTHVEFHNTTQYACYVAYDHAGVTVSEGSNLGVLGSTNSGAKQACASVPGASTSESGESGVSTAVNPVSGMSITVAQGPNHSLYYYWQTSSGWHGPLGVGAGGSTYSAPSVAFNSSGLPTIAVEGPNSTLQVYWYSTTDNAWHGPLTVGGVGSTFSNPSIAYDVADDAMGITAQGPNNSLYYYWYSGGWQGPLGIGGSNTTYSSPALAYSSTGSPAVAAQGPSHSLYYYWVSGGSWNGPLGVGASGTAYSSPAISFNGAPTLAVQGPNHTLYSYWYNNGWNGPLGVGGSNSTYSAPAMPSTGSAITAQGPNNSLYYYWYSGGWQGPLGIGGGGSTFSNPAIALTPNGAAVAAQGPSHSLYNYWYSSGWHGPLGVGASNSTY